MAQSVRTLLDTVVQALPEVSNLGLLFFLLFFIFAALGVELFGRVGACSPYNCFVFIKQIYYLKFADKLSTVKARRNCDISEILISDTTNTSIILPHYFIIE